ncbi:MAG: multiheme c-type cytochrome [Syntrophales bacterium]|nr:multiheme c-type cytochrome [Syntrophales bacterium]
MGKIKNIILLILIFSPTVSWSHQDIWLKNEQGERITHAQNSVDPYSPRRTCGGCHNYSVITSGYHFQQGFDEMSDRYDSRRPWILSPGMFGKWLPTAAAGRLSGKVNTDLRRMDLTTYDWIGGNAKFNSRSKVQSFSCGSCHPGGGPMEYGRDSRGKADSAKNLIEGEAARANPLDGDYSSQSTPDKKSHFRESGVVEADCLLCHMAGYGMAARNEQLGRRNYRWAATAGAGFGTVRGAVFTYANPVAWPDHPEFGAGSWNLSRRPVTMYNWSNQRLFTHDGRIKGQIVKKAVASKNCLQCHAAGEAKNTGTLHASGHDAHAKGGLGCTDCHGLVGKIPAERIRHQIAKGRSPNLTVRNDLDGVGMKTCIGCHHQGQYRPSRAGMAQEAKNPKARHAEKFPKATFHTYLIACNGCHTVSQPARAMTILDMSAGLETGYTTDRQEGVRRSADYEGTAKEPWMPWMIRDSKYLPVVPKWLQWFGEKEQNGQIRPIPLRYVRKAAWASAGLTAISAVMPDGSKQKRQTVVTDKDIAEMSNRLTKMGFRNIAYVSDKVYELKNGKVVSLPTAINVLSYPVDHGVLSLDRKLTMGTRGRPGGCMDCHNDTAPFFSKMVIKNVRGFLLNDYPELKEPNAEPQYQTWGLKGIPAFE